MVDSHGSVSPRPVVSYRRKLVVRAASEQIGSVEVSDPREISQLELKFGALKVKIKFEAGSALPAGSHPSPDNASLLLKRSPKEKLDDLKSPGANNFVVVRSPTVGKFKRAATMYEEVQPPSCKEGDVVEKGQTIAWVDQLGHDHPVESDAAGEVLKFLHADNAPVGYGDPLVAILPE